MKGGCFEGGNMFKLLPRLFRPKFSLCLFDLLSEKLQLSANYHENEIKNLKFTASKLSTGSAGVK